MSIAELLANKRKALKPIVEEKAEGESEEIEWKLKKTLNYEEINKKLFLAMYAPYIKDPYNFNWFDLIKYRDFLFPDGAYILNTFQQLDIDLILESYIYAYEPSTLKEYSILCCFLNHLHLNVPKEYERDIILLIYSTEKNP